MLKLRNYQEDAIAKIRETLTKEDRTYVDIPTGGGKTKIFLSYAHRYYERVLIVVPSIQLMDQCHGAALNFYSKQEISRKGGQYNQKPKRIHICVVNSLSENYMEQIFWDPFNLIIVDEAHHSFGKTYQRLIEVSDSYFKCDYLGVTATPNRLDGRMLSDIFGNCSYKITIEEMISLGYLCDIEGYCVKTNIDIGKVETKKGDFSLSQLYKRLCIDSRNNMIVDIYIKEFINRKTLIFCINIDHSKQINALLNNKGISSVHIDGTMNADQRTAILSSFRNGEIQVLCNCQLLTEGFDEPSIDGIILARPTQSITLFTQMIGRGLRTFQGKKNCKIIDIVDNHKFLVGINCLVTDEFFPVLESFSSIKDIRAHSQKEEIKIHEYTIERSNFLGKILVDQIPATDSMIKYLEENKIENYAPICFNEASFLIWYNKIKKEYKNGINRN